MGAALLAGAYRFTLPQLVWGDSLENTLEVGLPVKRAETYPEPREGGSRIERRYGPAVDTVSFGVDYLLALELGPLPVTTIASGPFAVPLTGYDSAGGWDAFLRWAPDPSRLFHWIPDRTDTGTSYVMRLAAPFRDDGAVSVAEFRRGKLVRLTLLHDGGTPVTGY